MVRIRQCLASGLAVVGVSALVVSSAEPRDPLPPADQPAVALTAQVQPLPLPFAPAAPLELLSRQVNFHVDLLVDFVVTGAQLIARQVPVPGTLLLDLQNGTPLPVAVGRALQTLVEVELDAGRELVGYATEYIAFQARFLADLIALPFAVVAAVNEAVGSFFAAAVTPAPVVETSVPAQTLSVSPAPTASRSEADAVGAVGTVGTVEDEPKKPTLAVSARDADTESDAATTISAQGEVRSGTTEAADSTDTTDVDDPTSTARDEASEEDASGGEQRSEPEAEPDNDGADDAAQKDSSSDED
jgi:hypothetical protein